MFALLVRRDLTSFVRDELGELQGAEGEGQRGRVLKLLAQAARALDQPALGRSRLPLAQHDHRLATGEFADFAQPPGHGHAHAQANGLAEGLFGRKTRGQIAHTPLRPTGAAGLPRGHFGIAQHLGCKAFTVPIQAGPDAADVADVSTDAVNHMLGVGRWALWIRPCEV